jgi:hypothetical protein
VGLWLVSLNIFLFLLFSRGDDEEDKVYSMTEITDYEKRKLFSKTIDSEYVKAEPTRDIYNTQLAAEKQIYGEVRNLLKSSCIQPVVFLKTI